MIDVWFYDLIDCRLKQEHGTYGNQYQHQTLKEELQKDLLIGRSQSQSDSQALFFGFQLTGHDIDEIQQGIEQQHRTYDKNSRAPYQEEPDAIVIIFLRGIQLSA